MCKFLKGLLICVFALVLPLLSSAEDVGLGNKILQTGNNPKPGFNYYFEAQYYFGELKTSSGSTDPLKSKVNLFVQDNVFEYNSPWELFGVTYSADFVVPFVSLATEDKDGNKVSATGIGDLYVEPIVLNWGNKYLQSRTVIGFNLPTGSGAVSKGHYSVAFSNCFSIYFNEERTFELAILPTYEIHGVNLSSNYKEGDDFILRWGLGYNFGVNEIGLTGYSVFQVTDDSGGGGLIPLNKAGQHDVHAAGVQYVRFLSSINTVLSVIFSQEFAAKGRFQGSRFHLTLIKVF